MVEAPTTAPDASLIGEKLIETWMRELSRRIRIVSKFVMGSPSLSRARMSGISCARLGGTKRATGCPIISSAAYP